MQRDLKGARSRQDLGVCDMRPGVPSGASGATGAGRAGGSAASSPAWCKATSSTLTLRVKPSCLGVVSSGCSHRCLFLPLLLCFHFRLELFPPPRKLKLLVTNCASPETPQAATVCAGKYPPANGIRLDTVYVMKQDNWPTKRNKDA